MSFPPEFGPGELLPQELLSQVLRHCGRNLRVYKGCRLVPPKMISLGDNTQIDEGVRIFAGQGVDIGSHVHLAFDSSISGGGSCVIRDFAGIAAAVRIITGTDLPYGGLANPTIPDEFRSVERSKVVIGEHALIYTGAIILPGVEIGEGAVVAAGSVVHHSLKPWTIYAGFPLVPVGTRDAATAKANAASLGAGSTQAG